MSIAASRFGDDPLDGYANGAVLRGTRVPVPLTATRFAVTIHGGVASVETWRTFRNAESRSIEVTLTVPMPIRAVLYALDLDDGVRSIAAEAQAPEAARARYEEAGDAGRRAVLHEEVLPGIHMVSIMHLAPGDAVTVRCAWAAVLTPAGAGRAGLRIPLTVGDIYGRSPLLDSDDLLSGGPSQRGRLTVVGDGVEVLSGGRVCGTDVDIPLDRPIDLSVPMRMWPRLSARTRDGRRVTLAVAADGDRDRAIAAAVLIDRSGSMEQPCRAGGSGTTKYEAVCAGIGEAVATLGEADRLSLFTFDTECLPVGELTGRGGAAAVLRTIEGPRGGGTEIGAALNTVVDATRIADIVLITDGKSFALDVPALLRTGRRFSVVLIGDDSLEARVGHLAAGSGGALVVARGDAVAEAVATALSTLRHPHVVAPVTDGPVIDEIAVRQDGMRIEARWDRGETADEPIAPAVRALATALALPRLRAADAARLAQQEGLVGRYGSLVLVDDAAPCQPGLAATRKVRLPQPDAAPSPRAMVMPSAAPAAPRAAPRPVMADEALPRSASAPAPSIAAAPRHGDAAPPAAPRPPEPRRGPSWTDRILGRLRRTETVPSGLSWPRIDASVWAAQGDALSTGDLSALPSPLAAALRHCVTDAAVRREAAGLGLSPLLLVIGLLARRDAGTTRSAERVARAVFRTCDATKVAAACETLMTAAERATASFADG